MKKKKIFIWSPFIDYVGTTISIKNSIISLSKFKKKEISITVINVFGEWNLYLDLLNKLDVEVINLGISNKISIINQKGFIFSRLLYFKIFFLSFYPLLKILKTQKPDYLLITLITFLPLTLNYLFNLNTKIILRISGFPKLNFIRYNFWKMFLKKVHWIFAPTYLTTKHLQEIFPSHRYKIKFIRDPVFSYDDLKEIKKKFLTKQKRKNYYLAIGRLTKQKNFGFLIQTFFEYNLKNKKKIYLLIAGDGEDKNKLQKLIRELKIEKNIKLVGFKKNIYKYICNANALVCTSLWEDPGFIIIESGICNTPVISNACPSGPIEILNNERNGYLYDFNSKKHLILILEKFETGNHDEEIKNKVINLKRYSNKFSFFRFYKQFNKYV